MCSFDKIIRRGFIGPVVFASIKHILIKNQDVYCCFCGRTFRRTKDMTMEHIVPRSHLESDDRKVVYDLDNLTVSCKKCNADRGTADFNEFRRYAKGYQDEPPVGSKIQIRRSLIAKVPVENRIDMCDMFAEGYTIVEITSKHHTSKTTVLRVLRERGMIDSVKRFRKEEKKNLEINRS